MRLLILGCGRVGATLANIMNHDGHTVTVIDLNTDAFERLGADFEGTTIVGDGTDEDVLIRAGIEEADAFAAVTNGDNRNILAAQIAKYTFAVDKVICRIYDPIRQETYNALGLESISPTVVGAKLLKTALLNEAPRTQSVVQSIAEGRGAPPAAPREESLPTKVATGENR
ncbi:MAG TPA: TrkA family potassium uptake protein [Ktedonobacterales bacterium]|nr:TrkA family potassium uptake protein [Ktedonobacterales bacterium]